jgi:hypothetical protein
MASPKDIRPGTSRVKPMPNHAFLVLALLLENAI